MKKIALKFFYIFILSIIFSVPPAFCMNYGESDLRTYDVIIIGAGFSGVYTALELAKDKNNYKILVLEQDSQIIGSKSTSFNQCYKLHSGLHYFGDLETAKKCLINSIVYAKRWSSFLLVDPETQKLRRNVHYVMSNSLFGIDDAKEVGAILNQTYVDLIKEDPANQVLGDPREFIKEIDPNEYDYLAEEMFFAGSGEAQSVVLALDVAEPQIDMKKMREYLYDSMSRAPNIKVLFNHKVVGIKLSEDGSGYKVKVYGKEKVKEFKSKGIVNCAWHEIEDLNKTADIYSENPNDLLIRTKISLLVKLPKEIENIRSCIFSLGPFCSITNQYDGTAILTYEPVTNLSFRFLRHKFVNVVSEKDNQEVVEKNEQEIAQKIIDGCAIFVPAIKEAQLLEIREGHVKMYVGEGESYSIYNKESPIHRRREGGVEVNSVSPLFISVSGMKMTYAQNNAKQVRDIVNRSEIKPN